MSQTERIFFIDRRMRDRGGVTVSQISQTFEVCARQAKRDIEYMRDRLNAPIAWSSPHRRYEYSEQWEGLRFADEKSLLALSFLRSILSQYHYVPVLSEELVALAQEKLGGRYAAIADKVIYELSDMESLDNDIAYALCQSLLDSSSLGIEYIDSKGQNSRRRIVPARLVNYSGKWYCIALDSLSGELRTFSVARIHNPVFVSKGSVTIDGTAHDRATKGGTANSGAPSQAPTIDAVCGPASTIDRAANSGAPSQAPGNKGANQETPSINEADVERYISASYGIFKGKPIGTATLRFYGGAARAVREQVWHKDQVLTEVALPGGEAVCAGGAASASGGQTALDLTLPVHDWTELLGRALRCGANCEVMGPAEFRRLWMEEIDRMKALTEKSGFDGRAEFE